MTFEFRPWLEQQQQRVEALISSRLRRLEGATPPRLLEVMQYSLLGGGKRLRPVLCLAFADAIVGRPEGAGDLADDAAWALECVHTYSLIHDDLPSMDNDDLRRGRPTSHRVFGEALAILGGDALLTEAFARLGGDDRRRGQLVAELAVAAGAAGMVGGQVLDIAPARPREVEYLVRLHRLKTGALIKAACRMGAIAAAGDHRAVVASDAYGEALGLAFQIADDVLDVTSTTAALGKTAGADAAAGRWTFPAVIGLEESRRRAAAEAARAVDAVKSVEAAPGPLAALAAWAVERGH